MELIFESNPSFGYSMNQFIPVHKSGIKVRRTGIPR